MKKIKRRKGQEERRDDRRDHERQKSGADGEKGRNPGGGRSRHGKEKGIPVGEQKERKPPGSSPGGKESVPTGEIIDVRV